MTDQFSKEGLKATYERTNVGNLHTKALADWALGRIKIQAIDAAENSCSNIQIDLRDEYHRQRSKYFSPREYSLFRAYIELDLNNRKIKFNYIGDGYNVMIIDWL